MKIMLEITPLLRQIEILRRWGFFIQKKDGRMDKILK